MHSDLSSARTTIAVQLPGNMPPYFVEAAKRKLEYELHKMQAEMSGALMGRGDDISAREYLHRHQQAMMQAHAQAQEQARQYSPYGQNMVHGIPQGSLNAAMASQLAGVQSAQPKPKKYARKKLLLCEVKNAV